MGFLKRHECEFCGKSLGSNKALVRHRRTHTGERPFLLKRHECEFCGKSLGSNKDLVRHRRTHTGERPFKCGICAMLFTVKSSLQRHMRRRHRDDCV